MMSEKQDRTDRYGCAVLAGGEGKRMGCTNKAALFYNGMPFLKHICSEMNKTGRRCYLSTARYEQELPAGWKLVRDTVPGKDGQLTGPMGGIYSCLMEAREDGLAGLFFSPCDTPLFSSVIHEKLKRYITPDTDAVCWKTGDGRIQTTFGWYSVRCAEVFGADAQQGRYKLTRTLEKLQCRIVKTGEAGLDDRLFLNINCRQDYRRLIERRHILICGKRQTGKTTLIDRILKDLAVPVCGYRTRIFRDCADGISRVYMFPAREADGKRRDENYIGSTKGKVLDVRHETFENLGTGLIRRVEPGSVILMDEIGFMESRSPLFLKAVEDAFDGDRHILAAIRDTDKLYEHIERIRNHPKADLFLLTEENRDEVYRAVREMAAGWMQELTCETGTKKTLLSEGGHA